MAWGQGGQGAVDPGGYGDTRDREGVRDDIAEGMGLLDLDQEAAVAAMNARMNAIRESDAYNAHTYGRDTTPSIWSTSQVKPVGTAGDPRNIGTKFGDWFEKNNVIIQALRALGIDAHLDRSMDHDPATDRDDSWAIHQCESAGGTWDGGQCIMPSDSNGNGNGDDDNGDDDGDPVDYGKFGKPNPFASLTRRRQMWYHPMMGGTGHGQVYDPYSGERPDYIDANIWDYAPPRGGAELSNWATALRRWGSGE